MRTNYWMVAIGDHPLGDRTLPRFGCVRPDLAAMSLEFVREPSVAERIRALAGRRRRGAPAEAQEWRKLYVRALAAFFRAWHNSARRIVPGSIDPANVAVPDLDYHEGALILSLAGWEPYREHAVAVPAHLPDLLHKAAAALPGGHAGAPALRVDLRGVRGGAGRAAGPRAARPASAARPARRRSRSTRTLLASLDGYLRRLPGALSRAAAAVQRHRPLRGVEPRQRRGHRRGPRPAAGPAHGPLPSGAIRRDRALSPLSSHLLRGGARRRAREAFDRLLDALRTEPVALRHRARGALGPAGGARGAGGPGPVQPSRLPAGARARSASRS